MKNTKHRKMKHFLLKVLTVIAGLLVGLNARAYDAKVDGIYYNFNKTARTATVTYYTFWDERQASYSGSVTIPESVTYNGTTYSVTSIGELAFADCEIYTVIIPNSVTTIGKRAFRNSTIQKVTIPESVTSIGGFAFGGCSVLMKVVFNAVNCTEMGGLNSYVFDDCDLLRTVAFGDKVKIIPDYAFSMCTGLSSVTVPESVTTIGRCAFFGCNGLESVKMGGSVQNIGNQAFYCCNNFSSITLPNTLKKIGVGAFGYCKQLRSITIPESVDSIFEQAFDGCEMLQSAVFNCKNYVERRLFNGCKSLKTVTIGNGVKTIPDYCFVGCLSLSAITIPESVTTIGHGAFSGCSKLEAVNFNAINCQTEFRYGLAFKDCLALRTVDFGENVEVIPDSIFYDCDSLKSISIGNSVKKIGLGAFYSCGNLNSVIIPNSVIEIDERAFEYCGSDSVIIGDSVKHIRKRAFASDKIKYLKLGRSIQSVRSGALGCNYLEDVEISDLSAYCKIDFEGYGPLSSTINLTINGIKLKDIVIPKDITEVKKYAFCCFDSLTSVVIPNSVTQISLQAFYGDYYLRSVVLGNSVDTIGARAFNNYDGTFNPLRKIVSLNPTPPACESIEVFPENSYSKTILYVPKDCFSKYFVHNVWGKFTNIKKIEAVATQINLSDTEVKMDRGENMILSATIVPNNTTLNDLSWESSNTDVVVVDQAGRITALKPGTATITVRALDGSDVVATCTVIVKGARITLSHTEVLLPVNDIMTLSYTVEPDDVSVEWSSSDSEIAYIKKNADGSVTVVGMAEGISTITARALDGSDSTASCLVRVGVGGVDDIEADGDSVTVVVENGNIVVRGTECGSAEVEIYTVGGMLVYRGCDTSIPVISGMYIVKVNGKTYKTVI